jgi:3-methyladenine DNA glycosylase AlkC
MAKGMASIPPDRKQALDSGEVQSAHLVEWLSVNHGFLFRTVANTIPEGGNRLREWASILEASGWGIMQKYREGAKFLSIHAAFRPGEKGWCYMAEHPSDSVRGMACFLTGFPASISPQAHLSLLNPFIVDSHFGIRELAWISWRPHMVDWSEKLIPLLETMAQSREVYERRFSTEVSRPIGVWAPHIPSLKRSPEIALPFLSHFRREEAPYVQLSVGNWLNDASKTRPDWVKQVAENWLEGANSATIAMLKRGVRTLVKQNHPLPHLLQPRVKWMG